MKNTLIVLFATGISFAGSAQAQSNNPPDQVKAAFAKSFAGSSNEKWEKEGKNYEVNFIQNGRKMSAEYNAQGALKETEVIINADQLPGAVKDYLRQHYNGVTIKEAARTTSPNGQVTYETGVNGKDLIFDKNGKFLKVEKD